MQYSHRNFILRKIKEQCSSTATSTVAQNSWPPTGEAEEAQTGGGRSRRSCGAPETNWRPFCWPERAENRRPAPEKKGRPASCRSVWRAWKPIPNGGKAAGGGERAGEGEKYLRWRLVRPPDLSSVGGGRWRSSGRCKRRRLLARIGITSERPSGASWMVGRLLRRLEEDPADRGFTEAAGGRGSCSLHVGPGGVFREVAGGLGKGSGRSNWVSGERRWRLKVGSVSDQWVKQLFVVAFGVCGEGKG